MMRNFAIVDFPDWYLNFYWGDWPLYVFCAKRGKIGYINESLGVYRVHRHGVWSGASQLLQIEQIVTFYKIMNGYLNGNYRSLLKPLISKYCFKLARCYLEQGNTAMARRYAVESLTECPFNQHVSKRQLLALLSGRVTRLTM